MRFCCNNGKRATLNKQAVRCSFGNTNSSVTTMQAMFSDAAAFNPDLSSWCVSNIDSEPDSFSTDSALIAINHPLLAPVVNCGARLYALLSNSMYSTLYLVEPDKKRFYTINEQSGGTVTRFCAHY